jgi:tRNA threonylcarbamoyladenosine biosynthesis protein TsaB
MSFLLNIDTSTSKAFISVSENESPIDTIYNYNQKEHAGFIHTAIEELLFKNNIKLHQLASIVVSAGPGSYTGLRVGLSSAKGLCYALNIPLIAINTLEMMANDLINQTSLSNKFLYCPMIDARRMEVFTAVYTHELLPILEPQSSILSSDSFNSLLSEKRIITTGDGSSKFHEIKSHPNLQHSESYNLPYSLSQLGFKRYTKQEFNVLSTTEPIYLKDFFNQAMI